MFESNIPYSRTKIQELLGGELQSYLPQKNGRILAGCFTKQFNPDAPLVIQAGKGVNVAKKAELLGSQPNNHFPVFLKEKPSEGAYYFVGYFRCIEITNAPDAIAVAETASGRHGKLSWVIHLEKV